MWKKMFRKYKRAYVGTVKKKDHLLCYTFLFLRRKCSWPCIEKVTTSNAGSLCFWWNELKIRKGTINIMQIEEEKNSNMARLCRGSKRLYIYSTLMEFIVGTFININSKSAGYLYFCFASTYTTFYCME